VDHGLAVVKVDRRAGERQRIDLLGMQRRVDRRQPAALAVADQVGAPAEQPESSHAHPGRPRDHPRGVTRSRGACYDAGSGGATSP